MSDRRPYAFDNAGGVQRDRLALLSQLLDDGTFRVLEAGRVQPGDRCWEVGAGNGSVAAWLCDHVGPSGSVLATDLDVTPMGGLSRPNLRIATHDVLGDELPHEAFDLVHARLLLAWLPDHETVVRRMAAALKPGGWLVLEEMDFGSVAADPAMPECDRVRFERVMEAHDAILAERHGFDLACARSLVGALVRAGLQVGEGEGRIWTWRGGPGWGEARQITLAQLRDEMIGAGRVHPADLEATIALCGDPERHFVSQTTMAVSGRSRPTESIARR